jgi:hypothetical protein
MWFLHGKFLLTKDNLFKRNWNGCIKWCFCDSMETVQHLFISCPFVRIIWRMIYFTYNISRLWILLICLVIGWIGLIRILKLEFTLAFLLCVGQYGIIKTILSLANTMVQFFCRLFEWLCTGFIYGPTSSRRISGTYEYWMQLAADSCSWLVFPHYWMAAY